MKNDEPGNKLYLLVGSYAEPEEEGIKVYTFDETTGTSSFVSGLKGISNPSYLIVAPDKKHIYAVAEDDNENASANALTFDEVTGELTLLNSQQTHGGAPCYINIDDEQQFVVTANYTGGNITVFPIGTDGKLLPASQVINFSGSGKDPERQKEPHLHSVTFSPDQNYLFAKDLGTDAIHKFKVKDNSIDNQYLQEVWDTYKVEPGSGPRHMTFHPNGKFAYLINEISGMVTAFSYHDGHLESIQYIPSDTVGAQGSADIHITPDGKFLYASNRLENDGLAIFSVDSATGMLTRIGYQNTGIHPRNFIISPNGKLLLVANRDSNSIQVFAINQDTGMLTDTGHTISTGKPVCLKFVG